MLKWTKFQSGPHLFHFFAKSPNGEYNIDPARGGYALWIFRNGRATTIATGRSVTDLKTKASQHYKKAKDKKK